MNRKGVEFTLLLIEPGLWKWRFQIGETVTTGTTETNLKGMAAHRAAIVSTASLESLALLLARTT